MASMDFPVVATVNQHEEVEVDHFDEERASRFFKDKGFTDGLIQTLVDNKKDVVRRFWIIDNSGSMLANDGQRLAHKKGKAPITVQCTRWKELQQNVNLHAE